MNMLKKGAAWFLAIVAAVLVAACGGGGSAGTSVFSGGTSGGTSSTTTPSTATAAPVLAVSLSSNTVTAAAPVTVTATAKTAAGVGVGGIVVTFTSKGGLGTFSVASALTNSAGVATVALYPATNSSAGADSVQAAATIDGTDLTASAGFQLTATNVTISSFTSDLGASTLSAYGQSTLTIKTSGAAAGSSVGVSLTSTCVAAGKASLTPAGTATTTNGTVNFTYKDTGGCGSTVASDTLTATVSGTTNASTLALPLRAPGASSITFTSATPATIYLKGSGFTESSTVSFTVVDVANNPLPNQSVLLEPTTLAGGLTMDGAATSVTKTSDSNGVVSVLINSGTVPTPVRIKATLVGSSISTVSSSLSIAVGLPSQLNFSLAQATKNIEGMDIDGTPNTYSIIASDRLGNPVPAGTAINFVTEGGQVNATGTIALTQGLARTSANFVSAAPRPADGRITVLAYTLGEESFIDTNGDNVFNTGEAFQDLGDVYLDRKFDGIFDPAADQFISLSITGSSACNTYASSAAYPLNLLALDPTIPSRPSTCDGGWGRAYVRRATETVLSTSTARPLWLVQSGTNVTSSGAPAALSDACSILTLPTSTTTSAKFYIFGGAGLQNVPGTGSVNFLVADANNNRLNPVAAGTTVSVTATTGLTVTILGGSPVPSSTSVTSASASYEFQTGYSSGVMTFTFTSPSGVKTTTSVPITTGAGTGASCTL